MTAADVPAHVSALDTAAPQRWRNGGGMTRELLVWPAAPDSQAWRVRISVADIGRDGPFSPYPGVTRCFCVLQGDGVELVIGGRSCLLRPGDAPIAFDGAVPVHAKVVGPQSRDLNLMVAGGDARMLPVQAGSDWRPEPCVHGVCGVFGWGGGILRIGGRTTLAVAPRSLVWFEAPPGSLGWVAAPGEALAAWWLWASVQP